MALARQKAPDHRGMLGAVLPYVVCAILNRYGIFMHYMPARVGNLFGASGQHKGFFLGRVFLRFLKNFGKVVLAVMGC